MFPACAFFIRLQALKNIEVNFSSLVWFSISDLLSDDRRVFTLETRVLSKVLLKILGISCVALFFLLLNLNSCSKVRWLWTQVIRLFKFYEFRDIPSELAWGNIISVITEPSKANGSWNLLRVIVWIALKKHLLNMTSSSLVKSFDLSKSNTLNSRLILFCHLNSLYVIIADKNS